MPPQTKKLQLSRKPSHAVPSHHLIVSKTHPPDTHSTCSLHVIDLTDDSTTINLHDGLDKTSTSEPNTPAPDSIDLNSQDKDNSKPELDHNAELGELFLHIF